ncbi:MAG: tetratricopeptide repeat protein, partial [Campylobacterota bacterium]|nr:tetratricopeptide repeat protein [Campylobacterota bacterium]
EALPLYKKALAINEKALGKDHPNTVGNYNNLAVCYYYAGDIDNALLTAQKGLGIGSDLYQQLISLKDSDK